LKEWSQEQRIGEKEKQSTDKTINCIHYLVFLTRKLSRRVGWDGLDGLDGHLARMDDDEPAKTTLPKPRGIKGKN
jgi:hypothetical protein